VIRVFGARLLNTYLPPASVVVVAAEAGDRVRNPDLDDCITPPVVSLTMP